MTGSGRPKWRRDKTGWRLELQTACRHHTLKEHLAPEVSLQLQPMGFEGHFYGPTSTTRGYIKTQTSKGKHHQLRWTEIKQTCYFVSCHLLHHHLSLSLSISYFMFNMSDVKKKELDLYSFYPSGRNHAQ